MTQPSRSVIKDALKNLIITVQFPSTVNGASSFVTVSRKLRLFNEIDPSVQPECDIVQHRESYQNRGLGTPAIRILDVGLWCYAPAGEGVDGDELLDSMFQGIESVFVPDDVMTNELTFGGLCEYAKIDRRDNMLIRDPGDIDGQALLIVPVRIMFP